LFLNIITTIKNLHSKTTFLVLILNYLYRFSEEKRTRCQFNKSMNSPSAFGTSPKGWGPFRNRKDSCENLRIRTSYYRPVWRFLFNIFRNSVRSKRLQIYVAFSLATKLFLRFFRFYFLQNKALKWTLAITVFAGANIQLFFKPASKKNLFLSLSDSQ
jgi:hypothetical protein